MSLIRFDSTSLRGPSAQLWAGIVDWVKGSLATALGQRDFEDFAPFLGPVTSGAVGREGGSQVSSLAGTPDVTLTDGRFGIIKLAEAAASNEAVGLARDIEYDLDDADLHVVEARLDQNADANSPQTFVGFCAETNPDDVFASSVIASGGSEEVIGILWNADETFDIVAVDAGTLTVLKNDIGVTVVRTAGFVKIGLRIERVTSTTTRLVPSINGSIARAGIVKVLTTLLPTAAMRPTVANTVNGTTALDLDLDYIYSADK